MTEGVEGRRSGEPPDVDGPLPTFTQSSFFPATQIRL